MPGMPRVEQHVGMYLKCSIFAEKVEFESF